MLRRTWILAATSLLFLAGSFTPSVIAQEKGAAKGTLKQEAPAAERKRVTRTDGKVFEGVVTELPDGYRVRDKYGIETKIGKNEVKEIKTLTDAPTAGGDGPVKAAVSDQEIADILGETPAFLKNVSANPYKMLRDELPEDRESIEDMKRIAGKKANEYMTAHYVFIYTSERAEAVTMAAKLEGIYDWVTKYMEQLSIPPNRPKSKLEVFFFGTHEEFLAYQTLNGMNEMGVLGFYSPSNNRSAFFEMHTWPPVAKNLEALKQKGIDPQRRRKLTNELDQFSVFHNLEVVQHEAAHQVHFNLGVFPLKWTDGVPRWAVEGLATMFEVPQSSAGGSLGAINHKRLQEFRESFGDITRLPPQRMLMFIMGRDYLGSQYNVYVMGWALHHYLRTAHRPQYARYMQLLASRGDPRLHELTPTVMQKEFEELFGTVDEEWMKSFAKFMNEIVFVPSAVSVDPFSRP